MRRTRMFARSRQDGALGVCSRTEHKAEVVRPCRGKAVAAVSARSRADGDGGAPLLGDPRKCAQASRRPLLAALRPLDASNKFGELRGGLEPKLLVQQATVAVVRTECL